MRESILIFRFIEDCNSFHAPYVVCVGCVSCIQHKMFVLKSN